MEKDHMPSYLNFAKQLRDAGIPAEVYLGESGLKAQFKYADKRRSVCAVIQGSNERETGEVQIKDLITGAQMANDIADHKTWKETRPAQVMVPVTKLVDTVREIYAHHGLPL